MAAQTRTVEILWENGVNFKVRTRLNSEDVLTVLDLDENGHLAKMWDAGVKNAVMKFFETELDSIGTEMKA